MSNVYVYFYPLLSLFRMKWSTKLYSLYIHNGFQTVIVFRKFRVLYINIYNAEWSKIVDLSLDYLHDDVASQSTKYIRTNYLGEEATIVLCDG